MKTIRRAGFALMLLAIPAAVFAIFLVMQNQFRDSRELRRLFDHSLETRAGLADLQALHFSIEAGQRGYLLTGDDAFLKPYTDGKRAMGAHLRRLEEQVHGEPEIADGIARLLRLSEDKLAFVDATVAAAQAGNIAEARDLVSSGRGMRIMNAIRTEVTRLDRIERVRFETIARSRDQSAKRTEFLTYGLLGAFSLLLLGVGLITRKLLRERRSQFARARSLNAKRFAILNGAVDGLLVLDANGDIRELNVSIERLFGYSEGELIGRHNTFLMAYPPTMEASMAFLQTVGSAGLSGAGRRIDFTGKRKDGSIFETDVAISKFQSGGEDLYVASVRDVTERKRIETMKTEFVATVSHELRTPLTSIGGSLGLLAAGAVGPLNEKAARLVTIAHTNCQRLIRLINDMLDIEKIESGQMNFDLRRMPLGPLIARTVAANRAFAEAHHVKMSTETPPWPIPVMGDPDKLEQLLTNLLSNAIKHSPSGGRVEVRSHTRLGRACVEVLDRGSGVPEAFRDRIFDKFAMADSSDSRAKGGTGLGLAIAREIAIRHGGQVGFEDRDGGGSVFFFDLPLTECEDLAAVEGAADGLPLLLHIDDDEDCLTVAANAFAGRATLRSVTSLAAARRALKSRRFAGAIVDIVVPPDNGLDLVPALREAAPGMPIVVFTAHDELPAPSDVDVVLTKSRTSFETLVETTMALVARASREAA